MSTIFNKNQISEGQRAAILTQLPMAMIGYILVGPMMMLYANDVLGFSSRQIAGILSLIPLFCIPSLLVQDMIIAKGKVRALITGDVVRLFTVLILFLMPLEWITYPVLLSILVVHTVAANLGPGLVWQPILRDITSTEDRGRFFSRMRLAFTSVSLVTSAGIPFFIGDQITNLQYKGLLGLVIMGICHRLFWSRKIPEIKSVTGTADQQKSTWLQIKDMIRDSKLLRRPLLIGSLLILQQAPMYVIFLKNVLHLSSTHVTILMLMGTLGAVLAFFLLGRVVDLLGHQPVLRGLLIVSAVMAPLHWFVAPCSPDQTHLLDGGLPFILLSCIAFFGGFTGAGIGLATTSIEHSSTSETNPTLEMNLFRVSNLLMTSLFTMLMGVIVDRSITTGPKNLWSEHLWVDAHRNYQVIMGLVVPIIIYFLAKNLKNTRESVGLNDFFSTFSPTSFRHFYASRIVHHENVTHRSQTARWLGTTPTPSSVNTLVQLLKDPSYDVKLETIRSLGYSRSLPAGKVLLDMLDDPNHRSLADQVCWALGKLEHKEAISSIIGHCHDRYPARIRAMACRSLGMMSDARVIPVLVNVLNKERDSQHLLASACGALLKLQWRDNPELIFDTLVGIQTRDDRYELLELISTWLNLPSRWILKSSSEDSTWAALKFEIDQKNVRWHQEHRETIDLFMRKDLSGLKQHFAVKIASTAMPQAMSRSLGKLEAWQPLAVVACAFLLLTDGD
jgi:Na+/melibiose symporter-like transporter